ncbi:MAG: hypothetical protein ACTSWY_12140 [Promethearchaeota archaeon]
MKNRMIFHRSLFLFIGFVFICLFIGSGFIISETNKNKLEYPEATGLDFSHISAESVNRMIMVEKYGIITVNDDITFFNRESNPVSLVYYCIGDDYESHLIHLTAQTKWGATLSVQEANSKINGYKSYIIHFNKPLLSNSYQEITVTTLFDNQIIETFGNITDQAWGFDFSISPLIPYEITTLTAEISAPSGYEDIVGTMTTHTRTEKESFYIENVSIGFFYNENPILEFTNIDRRIDVNSWGILKVTEIHELHNLGNLGVTSYEFAIPANASDFSAFDALGIINGATLSNTLNSDGKTQTVTMNLINDRSMLFGRSTIKYSIAYNLPLNNYFSKDFADSGLNINLHLMNTEILIKSQNTKIYLYAGETLIQSSLSPDKIDFQENSLVLEFRDENIINSESRFLYVEYQENGIQLIFRPFIYVFFIMAVISIYSILRIKTREKDKTSIQFREQLIPKEEIREFVSLYEEINAIRIDIREIESKTSRKKIAKKAGVKQKKVLESKLKETQDEIKHFKRFLINTSSNFVRILQRLDLKEAELLSNKDSLVLYDQRYKRGKLPSRQAYNVLRSQMIKTSEKIQNNIDKIINELKTYLI